MQTPGGSKQTQSHTHVMPMSDSPPLPRAPQRERARKHGGTPTSVYTTTHNIQSPPHNTTRHISGQPALASNTIQLFAIMTHALATMVWLQRSRDNGKGYHGVATMVT